MMIAKCPRLWWESKHARSLLAPALQNLIRYPYGCVEQTSSRCLALLAARHILQPTPFTARCAFPMTLR